MIIVLLGWFGWAEVKAQGADWLPVKFVRIEGAFQYIAKEKIKQVVAVYVGNGLYNVDVQEVRKAVKQLPWARKVKVKRIWPDAVTIKIGEQVPIVRWGDGELLNSAGQVFTPENIKLFSQLPSLKGPKESEKKLLLEMLDISAALMKYDFKLIQFYVNERRAWSFKLDNEIEIKLGSNKPKEKFKRFLKTLYVIGKEQVNKAAVVDLRYANGYTMTWKQGEKEIDWKQIVEMNKT